MTLFYVRMSRSGRLRGPFLTLATAMLAAGLRGRIITKTWVPIAEGGEA